MTLQITVTIIFGVLATLLTLVTLWQGRVRAASAARGGEGHIMPPRTRNSGQSPRVHVPEPGQSRYLTANADGPSSDLTKLTL